MGEIQSFDLSEWDEPVFAEHAVAGPLSDTSGALFIYERRIAKHTPDGMVKNLVNAGLSSETPCPEGELAADCGFQFATQLTMDAKSSIYFYDANSSILKKVAENGRVYTLAGNGTDAFSEFSAFPNSSLGDLYSLEDHPWEAGTLGFLTFNAQANNPRNFLVEMGPMKNEIARRYFESDNEFEFDSEGRHLATRSRRLGITVDSLVWQESRLKSRINSKRGEIRLERSSDGRVEAIVSSFGLRTGLEYGSHGYLTKVLYADGSAFQMEYDGGGLLTAFTRPGGGRSAFTYNEKGRLIEDRNALGGIQTLSRSTLGRDTTEVTLTDPLGRSETIRRIGQGAEARTEVIGKDGLSSSSSYSTWNEGVQRQMPDGSTFSTSKRFGPSIGRNFEYRTWGGLRLKGTAIDGTEEGLLNTIRDRTIRNDKTFETAIEPALRTATETTPMGYITSTSWDERGNPVISRLPGLTPSRFAYDANGLLSAMKSGEGAEERESRFVHDAAGNPQHLIDPLGDTLSLESDLLGRPTALVFPDGGRVELQYNRDGELISLKTPRGGTHEWERDVLGQVLSSNPPALGSGIWKTGYTHALDKQLLSVSTPDPSLLEMGYDFAGRLEILREDAREVRLSYNPNHGQVSGIEGEEFTSHLEWDGPFLEGEILSGPFSSALRHQYDDDLLRVTESVGGNPIAFDYDDGGRMIRAGSLSLHAHSATGLPQWKVLGNYYGLTTRNGFGEVTGLGHAGDFASFLQLNYSRDKKGRISRFYEWTRRFDPLRSWYNDTTQRVQYSYDKRGRLHAVDRNGVITTYGYDPNGNRTFKRSGGTEEAAEYDAQDRLLQYGDRLYHYNRNGNLAEKSEGGSLTRYQYDAQGNLRRVEMPNGEVVEYLIDGTNRRLGRKKNGAFTHRFVYSGQLRIVAELDETGGIKARYVYGTSPNMPEYAVIGGRNYRIGTDHAGSPLFLWDAVTGEEKAWWRWDEFGNLLADSNGSILPFGFAGGLYDRDTRIVRFGARDYDPVTGRWLSKDPIGFDGGTANLYEYAGNDPINERDPSGLYVPQIIGIVLGGSYAAWEYYDAYRNGNISGWEYAGAIGFGSLTGLASSFAVGAVGSIARGAWTSAANDAFRQLNHPCNNGFDLGSIFSSGAIGGGVGGISFFAGSVGDEFAIYINGRPRSLGVPAGTIGDIVGTYSSNKIGF